MEFMRPRLEMAALLGLAIFAKFWKMRFQKFLRWGAHVASWTCLGYQDILVDCDHIESADRICTTYTTFRVPNKSSIPKYTSMDTCPHLLFSPIRMWRGCFDTMGCLWAALVGSLLPLTGHFPSLHDWTSIGGSSLISRYFTNTSIYFPRFWMSKNFL